MKITFKDHENKPYVTVFLDGDFETEHGPVVEKELIEIFNETSKKDMILDLSKLVYLNSTALNSFVNFYTSLMKSGYKLLFCSLSKPVSNLFKISSLHLIIPIYNSEFEAIRQNYKI